MKILIYGDVHWSVYSSIVRKRNDVYSQRLDNLIKSVTWAEEQATVNNCDAIIGLGDFFDHPELTAEEISALNEVKWSTKPHTFLVGNHESNLVDLTFSSTQVFKKNNFRILNDVGFETTCSCKIMYLPYILEENRKSLSEYWNSEKDNDMFHSQEVQKRLIISHNDLKGVQYGGFKSKEGFDLGDIDKNCDLYVNGHLHNGEFVTANHKVLDLGNLTGLNFSEDASKYEHHVLILDTDDLSMTFIENPFAFNFYKLTVESEADLHKLTALKTNAVCAISCLAEYVDKVKKILDESKLIVDSKIMIESALSTVSQNDIQKNINQVDHLAQFREFALNNLGNTDIVRDELVYVCGEEK